VSRISVTTQKAIWTGVPSFFQYITSHIGLLVQQFHTVHKALSYCLTSTCTLQKYDSTDVCSKVRKRHLVGLQTRQAQRSFSVRYRGGTAANALINQTADRRAAQEQSTTLFSRPRSIHPTLVIERHIINQLGLDLSVGYEGKLRGAPKR